MKQIISGVVSTIYPDNINTDDIIRADILQESTEKSYFAQYAFEKYDTDFVERCKQYDSNIVIGGENFGCGSSREQAVYAFFYNNVNLIIAKSYPDIFYRNSINNGLVLITFNEIEKIENNNQLEINLESKTIKNITKNEEYVFQMSDEDNFIMKMGGQLGVVKDYINNNQTLVNKQSDKQGGQTMVEKIISNHVGEKVYSGDKVSALPIDLIYMNEVIAPPVIEYYKNDFGYESKVFDKDKIFFIPDHTIPSCSINVSEGVDMMKDFASLHGLTMYKQGRGIEHTVFMEEGYILPGSIVLGTDSHTCTNGALNSLSFGVGTTDAEYATASGALFNFTVPESIKINLNGILNDGATAKDLILTILGKLGVDGASGSIVEFHGQGAHSLTIESRSTIANMAVEMSGRSAIFVHDEKVEDYVKNIAKFDYTPIVADEDAIYKKKIDIDLSEIIPCVAFPHKPANYASVDKLIEKVKESQQVNSPDFPAITEKDLEINEAFVGACTNGKYEDLEITAKILKGNKVHDNVTMIIVPASSKIYQKALKNGLIEVFVEAGALVESSNCGPCFGKHMGVASSRGRIISSSNRNYKGRMGHKDSFIFLASPATVAASAIEGKIADPRKYL